MNQNIYCNPRLVIDDREIAYCDSVSYRDNGGNALTSISATFTDPDLENITLYNKKVEFFLNYGSEDCTPIFRGVIKNFSTNDKNMSINALDARSLLTGESGFPVVIDDNDNYDGQTIIEFLQDTIDNKMNTNLLSTTYMNSMDKPIYMTGVRQNGAPYDIVREKIQKTLNDDDILSPKSYELDIIHNYESSSLVIRKQRSVENLPDVIFTYNDGIINLSYTDRGNPSFAIGETNKNQQVRFDYGNNSDGDLGVRTQFDVESRGEVAEKLIPFLISKQDAEKKITINASKGHYLQLGTIIRVEVPDNNVVGQYRLVSKSVAYNVNKVSCQLVLNKQPIRITDYIN